MSFETLMTIFSGGLFVIVCGLIVFIFVSSQHKVDSFRQDFNEFREMLDKKLTQLGHALTAIDKDLRGDIQVIAKDLRGDIHIHDRRISVLESQDKSRRHTDKGGCK